MMKKYLTTMFMIVFIGLIYFTISSFARVLTFEWEEPAPLNNMAEEKRLVLITQDMDTPFWGSVAMGARAQAEREGATIEVLGNYGQNDDDFLQNLELAIHAKVDGVIIQGLDTEAFKELTKIKAAFYSIPVITIAQDVPMEESLRRTYVGSNQYEAGRLLAEQMILDLNDQAEIVLFYDKNQPFFQRERIRGIESVLSAYEDIHVISAETPNHTDGIIETTQHVLNQYPSLEAVISVDASLTGGVIQEISRRRQVDSVGIYTFDEHQEIEPLLEAGKINALVKQSPEEMGRLSVQLIFEWLNGETVPLDFNGYHTSIEIVKGEKNAHH